MSRRLILHLCGGLGSWSRPYAEAGYDVQIIDPIHDRSDVRLLELLDRSVHGILAAPPCTHFAASGARWWAKKGPAPLLEGLSVVDACLRVIFAHRPVWWALENPVGRLRRYLGDPSLIFNPCDYGDPYTKKTCVWGKFIHPKKNPVTPTEGSKMHLIPPSPLRWQLRSQASPAFAQAFFEANP